MPWQSEFTWTRSGESPIQYDSGQIFLAAFELRNAIVYSASDSLNKTDFVVAYPDVVPLLKKLKSQGWTIVFFTNVGKGSSYDSFLNSVDWIDWLVVAPQPLETLVFLDRSKISPASFVCRGKPTAEINPLELAEYRAWDIFSKWPSSTVDPSILASVRGPEYTDLIVFVGSSGSGRDEAGKYLKSLGYVEVRRKNPENDLKVIQTKLGKKQRIFYNATNPRVADRSLVRASPQGRIWWFARAGREFSQGRIPEAAYDRYSNNFEIPSPEIDKVPVIRMT